MTKEERSAYKKPIAVLTSDVHYNVHTLELADTAMRMAVTKANELQVPLIVAGDLHDTKANLRGECVNAMIKTFSLVKTSAYILVGNHDKINEKSSEHSLNFLMPYATVVNDFYVYHNIVLVPYKSMPSEFNSTVGKYPQKLFIVHQGLQSSNAGDYIQDKSATTKEDVAGLRVISGHYHTRQTIALPDGGQWDYIGNPYTLTFGEARDPEKGFQILHEDGSLDFVPTNLRKHIIFDMSADDLRQKNILMYNENDLLWVKITGSKEQLMDLNKGKIAARLGLTIPFKLDIIPTETSTSTIREIQTIPNNELLDSLIDSVSNTSEDRKARLKDLWRDLK